MRTARTRTSSCCAPASAQKPGEERPALLARNAEVFRSIVEPVVRSGFSGIFLVATNPVDVMTRLTQALSGFAPGRVVGTGTALDTARLRYLLGEYFCVDPRNVHAYVMGEHGESEFVPWSQAMLATKPVFTVCEESGGRFRAGDMEASPIACAAPRSRSSRPSAPPTTASAWRWRASPARCWATRTAY